MINLLNEKHITNANVYVAGEKVEFVSLVLEQSFGEHHTFSVTLDYDVLKQSFLANPLEEIKLIGKFLDIDLQQGSDSANTYEFRGIICDIIHEAGEGKHGFLIIEGSSPTILLERGKRLDIFSHMNLKNIFEEVTAGIVNKSLSCVNQPVYTGELDFLMQYQESDWEFLQRLSAITGETLFYTGRDLVFGDYKDWKETVVTYDEEITRFKFGSRLIPNHFSRYQYLTEQDDTIEQQAPASIENSNEYIDTASDRSKEITENRPVYTPASLLVNDKGALDELVKREKTTNAAQVVYIKGTAKTCVARIGRLLTVNMAKNMLEARNLGTYRVTKVKHTIDQNHRYSGEFEAVPASLKFISSMQYNSPVADSVRATVIKNTDPKGQGRVRVEFPFAQNRANETWIRVMTQDAGVSSEGTENRGMVCIPEIGDQVMIGFEFGDPNRPYVMGSMFHGKNTKSQGGGDGNHIKTFTDKSGSYYKFNSKEGSVEIHSKKGGSTIKIDGKGSISIDSPDSIVLRATNISLQSANKLMFDALPSVVKPLLSAAHSAYSKITDDGVLEIKTQKGINIISEEEDVTIKAEKKNVNIESTEGEISIKAKTNIKMEAPTQVEVKTPDMLVKH